MASKNQQYAEQYAEYAMLQMRLYGIPASVTLAQGILESANGQSQLARNENNHFGIKASKSWLDNGGRYGLYTDDRPNEKFCSYDSVADSYTHHSQVLKNNSRYSVCFRLPADDYKGWAQGLDKAGYATAGSYAPSLISIIERNGLQKYDRMVIEQMKAEGLSPDQGKSGQSQSGEHSNSYSFPLKRDEFMLVTSPFGIRNDPVNPGQQQMHRGIDIQCNNEPLLATEDNGKVIATNDNANTPGGKSVTVEYQREDGSRLQVYYAHLSAVDVKEGDSVRAGMQIGVSGNTGTRTTGPHLHLGIKQVAEDGSIRDIDPAAYLAEIAQKGNIFQSAMYNGTNLLAKYKTDNPVQTNGEGIDTSLGPDDWMKKLLSSEDSGIGIGGSGQDPVMDMVITLFTSLMALAVKIDGQSEDEMMQSATESAINRAVDLTPLVPGLQECRIALRGNDSPMLSFNDGNGNRSHMLTSAELNRLNLILSDSSLGSEQKQQRVASVINNIILSDNVSHNYDRGMGGQSMSDTITR